MWGLGVQVWTGTWTPRQEWSGLVSFVPRVQARHAFRGTQLGYIGSQIAISVRWYDLATVEHHSKNWKMKDGKIILIAYHLLESSTGAYIEWLVNEVMLTAKKIEYKDARLVMLPTDAINAQAR